MDRTLRTLLVVAAAAAVLAGADDAHAIDITWGDVEVVALGSYGFTTGGSELSFDSGTTDELFQMFGYLGNTDDVVRVNGNSFNVQTGIAAVNNVATSSVILDANGAAALGLTAGDIMIHYTFTLIDDTSVWDRDQFLWDVTIQNLTGTDLDLVFYSYLDLDLDGSGDFADDEADANTTRIIVSDPDTGKIFNWKSSNGGSADHFEVAAFDSVRDTLDAMNSATDLSDSQSDFGPADFTAAFQYNITVPANDSVDLGSEPITMVPEPTTAFLTMMGLLGLTVSGRRARRR